MIKCFQKFLFTILTLLILTSLSGCNKTPENTVFSQKDLCGKKIGVQLGTTGDSLASDYENPESEVFPENYQGDASVVERFEKKTDAVDALIEGDIDCIIIDEQPAQTIVREHNELMLLPDKLNTEEYAICVSKETPTLTASINEALKQLKADGTLDFIISSYTGKELKTPPFYQSPAGTNRSAGTLVMATNVDFEPYEYYMDDQIVGIDVEIAQAICDRLGYELEIEDMEFDAILNTVQSGRADIGVATLTITEERLQSIDFTDSYASSSQVIIVRK